MTIERGTRGCDQPPGVANSGPMNAQSQSPIQENDPLRALSSAVQALKADENDRTKTGFARAVLRAGFVPDMPEIRGLIARAISEAWTAPRLLFNAGAVLIHNGPCKAHIERAIWAWPKPLSETELSAAGPLSRIYSDELLLAILKSTIAADLALEKLLTSLRRIILEKSLSLDPAQPAPGELLVFASALARQCYINEYVFKVEKDEKEQFEKLFRLLKQKNEAALAPLWVAALASYMPLGEIPPQQVSFDRFWPPVVQALIAQQIDEPQVVNSHRSKIKRITDIEDDVSLKVQHQYEENPFPRWVSVPARPEFKDIFTELRTKLPHADIQGEDDGGEFNVLVAGCGTGQQLPEFSSYPRAKMLAIDLSLASLAYAQSKIDEFDLDNIEVAQADILKLKLPEQSFDLIVSTGVLHHMEDPEAGWRKLVSLLKPNGFMLIGLYSELARGHITAARAHIAAKKIRSTANAIRKFRQELITETDDPALRKILLAPDFYSLSECRDLLFHVQENRFTLPRIAEFIAKNGLTFLGFENTLQIGPEFARHFTLAKHFTDLDHWHAYEQKNPDTFASMYNFWLQKRKKT